jgi:hypothetical protein
MGLSRRVRRMAMSERASVRAIVSSRGVSDRNLAGLKFAVIFLAEGWA